MKVKYGLKNVHYILPAIGTDGSVSYTNATMKTLPGAVSLTMDPAGESTTFYADDTAYYTTGGSMGYTGELEVALITDEFRKDCLGEIESETGVLVEDANFSPVPFTLLFEFTTDENAVRHVVYNCTASRPSINGQTKGESTDVSSEKINLVCSPIYNASLGKQIVKAKALSTADAYSTWYTSVYQPTTATSSN